MTAAAASHPDLVAMLEIARTAYPNVSIEVWTDGPKNFVVVDDTVYAVDRFNPAGKRLPPPLGIGDPAEIIKRYMQSVA